MIPFTLLAADPGNTNRYQLYSPAIGQQPVAQFKNETTPIGQQPVDQLETVNNADIIHHLGG